MSSESQQTAKEAVDVFQTEFNLRETEARELATHLKTTDDVVEFLEDGGELKSFSGVGKRTRERVFNWFEQNHTDSLKRRREQDDSICTKFTVDPEVDPSDVGADKDEVLWAFICPQCGSETPCIGHPKKFQDRPFSCDTCNWVSLLDGYALSDFIQDSNIGEP